MDRRPATGPVQHNATPDTLNNGGFGTYLQTCDENGNPIIVKVG